MSEVTGEQGKGSAGSRSSVGVCVKTLPVGSEGLLVSNAQACEGEVLASETPLSLWGGLDPTTGNIIDQHHPLKGHNWNGRALVIPHGRGSCTGSAVLLEAIYAGNVPAMILLNRADAIIGLGAIVADEVLGRRLTVAVLDDAAFAIALRADAARVNTDGALVLYGGYELDVMADAPESPSRSGPALELSAADQHALAGNNGLAAQTAMRVIKRMAELQKAPRLIDVTRAHIDGCIYTGPAGLAFARQLVEQGDRVAVPTTLNAISIDRQRWRDLGVAEADAQPAESLAEAYIQLGAQPTYTCAPYLLDEPPGVGEHIAWAESNAVVFANSVLGARTDKTPDLMDACAALTGRAPLAGYYLDDERRARIVVDLPDLKAADDSLFPLLGYVIGHRTDPYVPVITGAELQWTRDALKAFGAAFATTSSAGMFHIAGVTPEAPTVDAALADHVAVHSVTLTLGDLQAAWVEFNDPQYSSVDLVALGNPHFSLDEFAELATLCAGRRKHDAVDVVVTTSRRIAEKAAYGGYLETLANFGACLATDTCWCMLREPIVGSSSRAIVTNSAKYAHYGPGLVGRRIRFANLQGCVEAAVGAVVSSEMLPWLVRH